MSVVENLCNPVNNVLHPCLKKMLEVNKRACNPHERNKTEMLNGDSSQVVLCFSTLFCPHSPLVVARKRENTNTYVGSKADALEGGLFVQSVSERCDSSSQEGEAAPGQCKAVQVSERVSARLPVSCLTLRSI